MSEPLKVYVRRGECWERFEIPGTDPPPTDASDRPVRGLDLLFRPSGRPAAEPDEDGSPDDPTPPELT